MAYWNNTKPQKIQLLSQVSTDKWYKTADGGRIFRFVYDPNPGWLRGNVRVYRDTIWDHGSGTKTWASVEYANSETSSPGGLLLRRHGDDFDISPFGITEVDVKRYEDALLEDLRKASYELQKKKEKVIAILSKLNSKSVV